ncbi:condensation domain-containing protein [Streptomyces sp. NPDC006984]|uniref:condensation domain-containing protein n=1 Tax=Streptomyces sp. NPDC006984 TaxID=3155463 RepID=UPI0033E5885A
MQQSMLVHEALANRPLYNMPLGFRISGRLEVPALERALHHVIRRHPVLHSTYDVTGAVPLEPGAPLPRLVLGAWEGEDEQTPVVAEFWQRPFDLRREVPVRALLMSASPENHLLVLAVHHVAGDSWALALLTWELGDAYARIVRGDTGPEQTPAPDFFAYAAQERAAAEDTAWWAESLRDHQPQPVPRENPTADDDRGRFLPIGLHLDAAHTQGVKRLAREARVSPAEVLFTAVSTAVAVASGAGSDQPCRSVVGLPVALRDTRELQETVGPLLNTLPVSTTWRPDRPALEIVQTHAAAVESALAHKHLPYTRILKAARMRRTPGVAPLLHLVNVDTEVPRLRLPGARAVALAMPALWATFPALWEFSWGTVGNINGVLRTDADSFTADQANDMAGAFRSSLARLIK